MIELQGKYGVAKVYTDSIEQTAISQIIGLLNQPFVKDASVRIMPDVHAGAGCVVGFTANLGDMVIPNLVGVDIGCGMTVVDITSLSLDIPVLDKFIHANIPAGFSVYSSPQTLHDNHTKLYCYRHLINHDKFDLAIGTLGGGNHFIEVNKSEKTGNVYLVIHTGSRNLGKQVADYYQKMAINMRGNQYPKELCFLTDSAMRDYLHDMEICQTYAEQNRVKIALEIVKFLGGYLGRLPVFSTVHNYINFNDGILRKGAVSAKLNEVLIIPMNMRDGSLLCIGKGNPDWNYSAPHGAGRIMSRGEAKRKISLDDYKSSMDGIYTTCVDSDTLDESPMAYKPTDEIIKNIGDTVDIVDIIRPIYNFKAGKG